ncbi:hypothetical protein FF1_033553 [Malus domestica]
MKSQKLLTFFLASMAISAALVTSKVIADEVKVPKDDHSVPLDPYCYDLCSDTFGDAECFATCKGRRFRDGNCIVQTGKLRCCCSR